MGQITKNFHEANGKTNQAKFHADDVHARFEFT